MTTIPDERALMLQIEEQDKTIVGATLEEMRERLLGIKKIKKQIETRKEEITGPMREALASARALFKPLEDRLEVADKAVRSAMLVAEEAREKDQLKLAGKVTRGEVSMDEASELMIPESSSFRMVKKMVIKNKKLIPKKYWVLDEVAIRADLFAGKKIPGALLVEEKTVVAK